VRRTTAGASRRRHRWSGRPLFKRSPLLLAPPDLTPAVPPRHRGRRQQAVTLRHLKATARVSSFPRTRSTSPSHTLPSVRPPRRNPEPPWPPPPAIAVRPCRRLLRPNYGHHPILGEHVVVPDPSPSRERRRSRRIPANRAAPTTKGGIARG
jgi:hypothetical protein